MKILSVIVLYNAPLEASVSYISLLKECNEIDVFIYDNSPVSMFNDRDMSNYIYVHDANNGGISLAYNTAAKYAKTNGYDWLLLLDQDTAFPADTMLVYKDAIMSNPEIKLFAPVLKLSNGSYFSPILEMHPRRNGLYLKPGVYNISDYKLVNSGLLIEVDAFWNSGGYNEKVRLDFADFQFITRFRKYNSKFCVIDCVAVQDFSSNETDVAKLLIRFVLFCQGAKMFEVENVKQRFSLTYVVLRRTCGLFLKTKKMIFFKIFVKKYL